MSRLATTFSSFALLLLFFISYPVSADLKDVSSTIRNFKTLNENISTSGAVNEGGLEALSAAGFKTILDLRTPAEGVADEQAAAEQLGFKHISLPVGKTLPSTETVAAFTAAVDSKQHYPLLVHCGSGHRAGVLWTMSQISKGTPLDQAISEGTAIGMRANAAELIRANASRALK